IDISVKMLETEGDGSTSELGIRSFFRGILPQWSKSSPVGAASPNLTNTNSLENGLDELHSNDQSHLKRKKTLLENDETDDSDYEKLPSCKRQRLNMSAMNRLFDKFSISESSASKSLEQKVKPDNYFLHSSSGNSEKLIKLIPKSLENIFDGGNSQTNHFSSSKEDMKETLINNNKFHIPNMNENLLSKKIIKEVNPSFNNSKDKKTKQEITSNKRQVTLSDNDSDDGTEHVAK
ncbi:unnamed protein product, partial [Meganyctiphanes norvegica]